MSALFFRPRAERSFLHWRNTSLEPLTFSI